MAVNVDAVGSAPRPTGPGSPSEVDWNDFVHTGPGTLAGRYMRLFWQPVYRAQDLAPGRAVPIRIMSEDFTLYRGEPPLPLGEGGGEGGKPHLLAFRCAHRGTQLSTGWVEGDDLRCFYHGWKYDGSGQCIEQPAEPEPFCQKIRIRSYPTEEYLGLIFAYLGDEEAPPLPHYPDFESEGVLEVEPVYVRGCNFFQNLENDPAHGAFVHRRPGLPPRTFAVSPVVTAEESEWGMTEYTRWPDGEFREAQNGMPNINHGMRKSHADPDAGWLNSLYWLVPIHDERHVGFTIVKASVTGEAADRYRQRRAEYLARVPAFAPELGADVLAGRKRVEDLEEYRGRVNLVNVQDDVSQIGQGLIADHSAEHLGKSDASVIVLRNLWKRELRALAEGRPLKQWRRTEAVITRFSENADSGHLVAARKSD